MRTGNSGSRSSTTWTSRGRVSSARLLREESPVQEASQEAELAPLGSKSLVFAVTLPPEPGSYQLEAALLGPGDEPVRSLPRLPGGDQGRATSSPGDRGGAARDGLVNLVKDGATAPEAAVDGRSGRAGRPSSRTRSGWPWTWAPWCRSVASSCFWDPAFGKSYAIEVSTDGKTWTEVSQTDSGRGGTETIRFSPVPGAIHPLRRPLARHRLRHRSVSSAYFRECKINQSRPCDPGQYPGPFPCPRPGLVATVGYLPCGQA